MYQIEHGDRLSMLSMGDSVSVFVGGSGGLVLGGKMYPNMMYLLLKGHLKIMAGS